MLWRSMRSKTQVKNLNGIAAVASLLLEHLPKSPTMNGNWLQGTEDDAPPEEPPVIPIHSGSG